MKKLFLIFALGVATPVVTSPAYAARSLQKAPVKWPTFRASEGDAPSPEIAALQYLLRGRGFYKGPIDGDFGAKMVAAVKAFQRKNGLKIDGVLGPQTLPRLVETVKRGSRGDAVRAAQLLARGATGHNGELPYAALEADGIFGVETEEAVKWAQATQNQFEDRLAETGVMSPRDWCLILGGRVVGSQW